LTLKEQERRLSKMKEIMRRAVFCLFVFALAWQTGAGQTIELVNPAAGVRFDYPASYRILEQSQNTSGCNWFMTLLDGQDIVRINLTGSTFNEVAASEYFTQKRGKWMMEGKPAKLNSRKTFKALEGVRKNSDGNDIVVTLAVVEHRHGCSAVLYAGSRKARAALYQIAKSFRFIR